ncbi:V-set and immunoglobulin domain-containing protein 1-like [Pimephales promelas]|nr:V-set and immunoglobulin domain-containing protein 1-like [Pimephales promelas]
MLDGVSEDNISTLNAARLSLVFHKGKDFDTCHQAVMLFISTSIEKLIRVDMYEAIHLSKTMQQYHVSMGWRQDSPDSSGSRQECVDVQMCGLVADGIVQHTAVGVFILSDVHTREISWTWLSYWGSVASVAPPWNRVGVTVEDVLPAIGEKVRYENITTASRMNKVVVVFVGKEDIVNQLISEGIVNTENICGFFFGVESIGFEQRRSTLPCYEGGQGLVDVRNKTFVLCKRAVRACLQRHGIVKLGQLLNDGEWESVETLKEVTGIKSSRLTEKLVGEIVNALPSGYRRNMGQDFTSDISNELDFPKVGVAAVVGQRQMDEDESTGVFGVGSEKVSVSVMEGESVTFYTGVQTIQQEEIKWYFYGIRIARINGDQSKICTDVQCNGGTERFRDRLKLDNQTGSLTITHTTNTDSGEYEVKIISSSDIIGNIFNISVNATPMPMPPNATLLLWNPHQFLNPSSLRSSQKFRMLAPEAYQFPSPVLRYLELIFPCSEITITSKFDPKIHPTISDLSFSSFRPADIGLTVDGARTFPVEHSRFLFHFSEHLVSQRMQCENLVDKYTTTAPHSQTTGAVSPGSVSAVEIDEVKRESAKEGEYVTFDPGVIKNPHDVMTWYYNNTLIAEITGDQRQICTDDQCKERFRDRLKLDHQTGSLTITHITNTHSGEYQLVISIINSSFSISRVKRFDLTVIDVPGSGLSPGAVAGICVAVVLLVSVVVGAAVAVIYYRHHENNAPPVQQDEGDADNPPSDPNDIPVENKEHPGDAENLRPDPEIFPFEDMAHPGDADKPPADPNENHL